LKGHIYMWGEPQVKMKAEIGVMYLQANIGREGSLSLLWYCILNSWPYACYAGALVIEPWPQPFLLTYLNRVSHFCPRWPSSYFCLPCNWDARYVSPHPINQLRWGLTNFLPGLASNQTAILPIFASRVVEILAIILEGKFWCLWILGWQLPVRILTILFLSLLS
jgi:hypothetical protein